MLYHDFRKAVLEMRQTNSQGEVAEMVGVDQATISRIENNEEFMPKQKTIQKIMEAFKKFSTRKQLAEDDVVMLPKRSFEFLMDEIERCKNEIFILRREKEEKEDDPKKGATPQ